jgi:hypothetical protein
MKSTTKKLMLAYAESLPPSTARAQCFHIAGLSLSHDQTIADAIFNDHSNVSSVYRAMSLMEAAGAARQFDARSGCYGRFIFEDGSIF